MALRGQAALLGKGWGCARPPSCSRDTGPRAWPFWGETARKWGQDGDTQHQHGQWLRGHQRREDTAAQKPPPPLQPQRAPKNQAEPRVFNLFFDFFFVIFFGILCFHRSRDGYNTRRNSMRARGHPPALSLCSPRAVSAALAQTPKKPNNNKNQKKTKINQTKKKKKLKNKRKKYIIYI